MSATYEVLEPGGHARLVGNMLDRIASASSNPASSAGSAAALLADHTQESWTAKVTEGDGAALIEAVLGNTLRWNQLAPVPVKSSATTANGITYTSNADGTVTVSGEATATEYQRINNSIKSVTGHKYCIRKNSSVGSSSGVVVYNDNNGGVGTGYNDAVVATATADQYFYIRITSGTVVNEKILPQIFDLTTMFGAGNEPATVAEFEALYPDAYYPYDAGSLLDVQMTGIVTTDADESWTSTLAIPATDLRSAGTVRDEQRANERVTRVGVRDYQEGDESDATVITDGTKTNYPLTTPTVTTIAPPICMSYRTARGGTESIAHTDPTAPPVLSVRYPLDHADVRDSALAAIAPVERAKASANYAVGSYLVHGGTLYRVTSAIASGESITPGTNVTATTVMAEILALTE